MGMLKLPRELAASFNPGSKPTGPIEIDWSNPITRGLVIAASGPLRESFVDFVGHKWNKDSGTPAGGVLPGNGRIRPALGEIDIGPNLFYSRATSSNFPTGAYARTTLFDLVPPVTTNTGLHSYFFQVGAVASTGESWRFRYEGNTGKLRVEVAGGFKRFATGNLQGTRHIGAVVFPESGSNVTDTEAYIDGVPVSLDAESAQAVNTNNTSINLLSNGGGVGFGLSSSELGQFNFLLHWHRELSPAEIFSLSIDPYQVFKPANDLYYFPVSAAGGGAEEASVSFAVSADSDYTALATAEGNTSFSASVDAAKSATAAALGGITFPVSGGFSVTGQATGEASTTDGVTAGASKSAIATGEAATSAGATAGDSISADAQAESSLAVAAQAGDSYAGEPIGEAAVTFIAESDTTISALVSIEAAITVSATADYTVQAVASGVGETNASITVQADVSITGTAEATAQASLIVTASTAANIIAEAAVAAGITVGSVSNVSFSTTTVSGDVTTPDGRTCTISARIKTCSILSQSRTNTIN